MDTSTKYIIMCKKAKEIQELWKTEQGDWGCRRSKKVRLVGIIGVYNNFQQYEDGDIWLPRQDQLQKIAFSLCVEQGMCGLPAQSWMYIQCMYDFMQKHRELIGGDRVYLPDNSITLEQWWLMLIMKKKYGKHWDNEKEEWVK